MKSLRKDVILDYDQVESTKLEKEILIQDLRGKVLRGTTEGEGLGVIV